MSLIRLEDLSDELLERQESENKLFYPDGSERVMGHDSTGNYNTAQMIYDEMFGGNTSLPLDD